MATQLPPMVWIAVAGNVLWIAIYAVLLHVIDFESDYMPHVERVEGEANA